jgi:hypothetical protein
MITEDMRAVYAALDEAGVNSTMPRKFYHYAAMSCDSDAPSRETIDEWTDPGRDTEGYASMVAAMRAEDAR